MEIDPIPSLPHPDPHRQRQPNPHHRKIELQSPLDLSYLRANIERAARERLDLHIPRQDRDGKDGEQGSSKKRKRKETAVSGDEKKGNDGEREGDDGGEEGEEGEGDDPLRNQVANQVSKFIDQTLIFAGQSISINGNDVDVATFLQSDPSPSPSSSVPHRHHHHHHDSQNDPPHPHRQATQPQQLQSQDQKEGTDFLYEPHDQTLSTHLASLYANLERETLAVSRLRRVAPAQGAKKWGETLLQQIECEVMQDQHQRQEEEDKTKEDGDGIGEKRTSPSSKHLDTLGHHLPSSTTIDEMEATYERGLADLRQLGGTSASALRGKGGGGGGQRLPNPTSTAAAAAADAAQSRSTAAGSSSTPPPPPPPPPSSSYNAASTLGLAETVGKVQRAADVVAAEF